MKSRTLILASLLISSSLAAATKAPAKPRGCQLHMVDGAQVWATTTAKGNLSTASCEPEITFRFTKRTKTFELRPVTSAWRCTAWVNPIAVPPVDLNAAALACNAAMDKAPH